MPILTRQMKNLLHKRSLFAFFYAIPISLLGGLMGLGGAEFRLPVLVGLLGYITQQAVPLNLAVSLVTIISSLLIRGKILSFQSLLPFYPILLSLILGAAITAFIGASLARHLSNQRLEQIILVLLVIIGSALIIEGFLAESFSAIFPPVLVWRIIWGIICGLVIGLVSSLLGVAGGEVIIPTLVFGFGIDIKTAGTGSLLVSLPTVLIGIIRYSSQGAFTEKRVFGDTIIPMGLGSIIGAIAGGILAGIIAPAFLKIILGFVLIWSAFRVFSHQKPNRIG